MCGSGKIVNVVINSNQKLNGGTNNDCDYFIDWSAILKDRTPYKLHFCYVGQPNTLTIASKLAQIQVDFQLEQYLNNSSLTGAPTTQTIGALRSFYLNGTLNYLYADDANNPAIYLNNRPYNNRFRVRVLNNDATPTVWVDNAGTPVANNNYMMILSFQEVDNSE